MTLKTKLISCIVAFVMVASLMLVGILASPTVTMQMGGNVSFTANSVYAKVTGSIKGSQENPTETALSEFTIDYDDTSVTMPTKWTNMGLTFDESATDIVVTMTIENLADDRAIEISLTDNSTTTNYQVNKTAGGVSVSGSTDTRTINGGEIVTYTFTLHVQSQNNPASGQFLINCTLNNKEMFEGYTATVTNHHEDNILYVWSDMVEQIQVLYGETKMIKGNVLSLSFNPNAPNAQGIAMTYETGFMIGNTSFGISWHLNDAYFSFTTDDIIWGSGGEFNGNYAILNYNLDSDIEVIV